MENPSASIPEIQTSVQEAPAANRSRKGCIWGGIAAGVIVVVFCLIAICGVVAWTQRVAIASAIVPTQTANPATELLPLMPKTALVGQWEEYWGVGDNSDVTYNDVYYISLNNNEDIEMTCPSRSAYTFENITFDGNKLTVTLDNDGFIIDYAMAFGTDPTLLIGTADTAAGKHFRIIWAKLR